MHSSILEAATSASISRLELGYSCCSHPCETRCLTSQPMTRYSSTTPFMLPHWFLPFSSSSLQKMKENIHLIYHSQQALSTRHNIGQLWYWRNRSLIKCKLLPYLNMLHFEKQCYSNLALHGFEVYATDLQCEFEESRLLHHCVCVPSLSFFFMFG